MSIVLSREIVEFCQWESCGNVSVNRYVIRENNFIAYILLPRQITVVLTWHLLFRPATHCDASAVAYTHLHIYFLLIFTLHLLSYRFLIIYLELFNVVKLHSFISHLDADKSRQTNFGARLISHDVSLFTIIAIHIDFLTSRDVTFIVW